MKSLKTLFRGCLPDWLFNCQPDARHAHRRRFTSKYRRKRECVKSMWIISGLIMLLGNAMPAFVMTLALATTFASFCILDETR